MPLKVLSGDGRGSIPWIANAIRYAADNGAQVINMSLGGPMPSNVLAKAVEYANEKGVTVVAAAGNESRGRVGWPAGNNGAVAVQGDVAEETHVAQLFEEAQRSFGGVDVVVNSAGIMHNTPIAEGRLEYFDRLIRTNLRGAYIVFAEAAKAVRPGGRIIGVSTSVIAKALPTYGAYIASKAGVEGLVHVLANELRGLTTLVATLGVLQIDLGAFTTAGVSAADQLERFGAALDAVVTAQESEDWLTVADVLEYDLEPAIRRWIDLFTAIADRL